MNRENSPQDQIAKLSQPNLWRFLPSLLGDWLGIGVGFSLFYFFRNPLGFIAGSIVCGIFFHGLSILGHEAVHYRVCKNRTLNEWIGRVFCFFPVGITVSSYREFHFPHHQNPNSDVDPEMPIRKAMGKNWVAPFPLSRGLKLWVFSFLGLSLKELGIFVARLPIGDKVERLLMMAYWGVAIAAAYHFHALAFVGLWAYSLASTHFSLLRIQAWYEHSLQDTHTNRYKLPNPLFRLVVPHNIWVHYEHHKYPGVPFYHLEKVRELDHSARVFSFAEMIETIDTQNSAPNTQEIRIAA